VPAFADELDQVTSCQASISMLSKPCATCSRYLSAHHDFEGKSDSSRSSSRRGSSSNAHFGIGSDSRKNSCIAQQLHAGSADTSSTSLPAVQIDSPISFSSEHPSMPGHTIVAASLRSSTRKSIAVQANGWLMHSGETLVETGKDAIQVVLSVRDR
jgi:hypothetical protein